MINVYARVTTRYFQLQLASNKSSLSISDPTKQQPPLSCFKEASKREEKVLRNVHEFAKDIGRNMKCKKGDTILSRLPQPKGNFDRSTNDLSSWLRTYNRLLRDGRYYLH